MSAHTLKINIVTEPPPGWILRQISESFALHLPHATVSTASDPLADINFYINYPLYQSPTRCDIGFFTHRESGPPYDVIFDSTAAQVDWCIAQCQHTADLLPPHKTSVIKVAPAPQFYKEEIVLGVVGREYPSGRKRFQWIEHLKNIPGIRIELTGGRFRSEELPHFYKSIDYLLVLSDNEGGPLPVLEALAMGKPIIAPDVGFAWDYPCLHFTTLEDLKDLLSKLVIPKNAWQIAADQLHCVFEQVIAARRS